MLLLPLLTAVIAAQGTEADMERTLNNAVRARIADGWTIADARTEGDDFVVTVVSGERVERHAMSFELVGDDPEHSYKIERDAKVPADPREPSELTLQALMSPRGGIEVNASCGEYYEVPYFVESFATREMAPRFVASTLATADDLSFASGDAKQATFQLERGGKTMKLLVWLGADGAVIEAQLRYYGNAEDGSATYNRKRQLSKALSHAKVTNIVTKDGLRLVTPKGIVPVDPHGNAFTNGNYSDSGEYHGCGC